MTWRLIYEAFGMYVAFALGCLAFFQLKRFQRLLFLQVALAVPIYFLTYFVIYYQKTKGLSLNNLWVHNVYILIETFLLALAAWVQLQKAKEKLALSLLYLGCLGIHIAEYYSSRDGIMHIKSFYAESILVVLSYSYLLYQLIHRFPDEWKFKPEFWMILGLLLYFAGDSPYMMLFNYFNDNYLELNDLLFNVINNFLANTRYLLLALGFWLSLNAKEKEL